MTTTADDEQIAQEPETVTAMFKAHDTDPRSATDASTIYRFDPVSRIHWLEFDGKPDEETRGLLKKDGWRWSGYRKQWYNNRRWTQVPEGIPYFNAGECDYSAARAERLEARAEKHSQVGQASYQRAHQIMDMIPPGQPILVGHHSERRHRRDIERIDNGMHKWLEESDKAKSLEQRAEGSIAHRAYLERPDVISRRLEKTRKEVRTYEGYIASGYDEGGEYQRRIAILKQEIARDEEGLESAGGIPINHIELQKGDLIVIEGHIVEVIRVNRKTITGYLASPVHNLFSRSSGYTERTERNSGQHDRTRFSLRIYTAAEWVDVKEGRTQAESYAIATAHLKEMRGKQSV